MLLLNHDQGWKEYLEAARFAIAQEEVQPSLFLYAFGILEDKRWPRPSEELEIVNGTLKLVLEKPKDYPAAGFSPDRDDFMKLLEQKRTELAAKLAGKLPTVNAMPPVPWKRSVCLLDLAKPINGNAWIFKPVVQDGQVYAVALGFHEWDLPEDSMQLVRVPLEGGTPAFLGRSEIRRIDWMNRRYVMERGPESRLADASAWLDIVRAACVGGGFYFAGTVAGVFIFPTNGGPVLHLGTTNGLPSEEIHAVAFLDGKLYIGGGGERDGYLASYDPPTRKVTILGSSRRSEHISPFDDQAPFYTMGLVADPPRQRLLLAVSSIIIPGGGLPEITPCMGIWSYVPATGEYRRLVPMRLCNLPRWLMHHQYWAGLVNTNVLATKQTRTLNLFDLLNDRLLFVYDPAVQTSATNSPWKPYDPAQGCPWGVISVEGPFLLRDGWFYSARPFARVALADGRREELPPPRTDYPFEVRESLQLLDDGKRILAADQYSIWLLELGPEPTRASVSDRDDHSVSEQ